MKKLVAAVFAVFSVRGQVWGKPDAYPLSRVLFAVMIALFPALAFAQAQQQASADPLWLNVLKVFVVLIPVVMTIHPLLMLSRWSKAKADGEASNTVAKVAFNGVSSIAASIDHFLEAGGHDFADLADPTKRAAAIKHIENEAITDALPALGDALDAMGKGWITGEASKAVDAALAKAPAAAVEAVLAKLAPAAPPVAAPRPPPTSAPSLAPAPQ